MAEGLKLNFDELPAAAAWSIDYDESEDTLYLRTGGARPATSVDLDGEVWARVDPTTGLIAGFDIEGFRSLFLRRHTEFARPVVATAHAPSDREEWLQSFFVFVRLAGARRSPDRRATA